MSSVNARVAVWAMEIAKSLAMGCTERRCRFGGASRSPLRLYTNKLFERHTLRTGSTHCRDVETCTLTSHHPASPTSRLRGPAAATRVASTHQRAPLVHREVVLQSQSTSECSARRREGLVCCRVPRPWRFSFRVAPGPSARVVTERAGQYGRSGTSRIRVQTVTRMCKCVRASEAVV